MKRFARIGLLVALCCLAHELSAAEPSTQDKQAIFEKVLAEKPVVPKGVVYKEANADDNRKAFDKLWQVFVVGDRKTGTDDLTSNILICGPGLWHNIKDDPEMAKLKLGVTKIKVPTNNGVQELDGKLFQNKEEVAAFWKAFGRKYKPDPQAKIRRPTARELDLYWAMIPYDITEPIFMIESKDAVILAQFTDSNMKLGWIDDYKDVHFKSER